jgi:hypothetical protein
MHHKRRRHKAARAGCLYCKPNKLGQGMENETTGQGARKELRTAGELRDAFWNRSPEEMRTWLEKWGDPPSCPHGVMAGNCVLCNPP